jgi:SAM-dependent methyltransferase
MGEEVFTDHFVYVQGRTMATLDMIKDGHLGGYVRGGDPGTWCPQLWSWVVQEFRIRSVLDVGCGEGHSTRFFQGQGCRALGVDGCQQAIAESAAPGNVVCHDFCEGAFLAPEPVDLIWSCEFLEHVQERYLPHILQTFAQARRMIFVTHAFGGQDAGHHHVNCRPSSYWIKQIESVGFRCDSKLTRQARAVTLGDFRGFNHFARSGLVFVRTSSETAVEPVETATPAWSHHWKAWSINQGFRWTGAYLQHRRNYRAWKRQRRRAALSR